MAVFGVRKRVDDLEAENAYLKQWIEHIGGTEAVTLAAQVRYARNELTQVGYQVAAARADVERARAEAAAERATIVEIRELAMLQEVGIYEYRHPMETALAYKQRLDELRKRIKSMVSSGHAVNAAVGWTVNNSRTQGDRMVRDMKKLMLRAYNAEADNAVRTLKPHTLARAIERLTKSRETIARLGKIMSIRVSDEYHRLRVYELELTADYLTKVDEEKERIRAERERQREEEKARREFEAAKAALRKEQAHYQAAYAKALASGDTNATDTLRTKLAEIGQAVSDVDSRAANIRAGYVYVISNIGAFGEHMIKVGMTRRLEPTDRIRELGDASVPFRFDTHALIFSEDAVGLENRLHHELADRRVNRVNDRREFFYATAGEVRDILARVGTPDLLLEYTDTAEALEWRASGAQVIETPPPAGARGDNDSAGTVEEPPATRDDPGPLTSDAAPRPADVRFDDWAAVEPVAQPRRAAPESGQATHPEPEPITPPDTGPATADTAAVDHVEVPAPAPVAPVGPASDRTGPTGRTEAADGTGSAGTTAGAADGAGLTGPGWHPDPWRVARLRWWDGGQWTSHTAS